MGSGWNVLQTLWLLMLIATWTLCLVGGWMLVREVTRLARPEPQRVPASTKKPEGTS